MILLVLCCLGVGHAAQPPAAPLSTVGMVAWWTGDGHPNDSFGSNHGALDGGTLYVPAVHGSGFSFDGVNDGMHVPDYDALKLTGSMSISAWLYVRAFPPNSRPEGQILFRGDNRVGLDPFYFNVQSYGVLRFHLESQNSGTEVEVPITTGRFLHVAATLDDASGLMRVYVNGSLAGERITQVRPFRDLLPAWNPGVGVGNVQALPNPIYPHSISGVIDELKLYSRARTADEIRDEYEAGISESLLVTGFESDRVARFDAGSGTFIDTVAGGGLTDPSGLAFGPDGNLYVGSLGNDRVLKYSATTGQYLTTFVSTGSGGLDGPEGIAFGPDGHLYVASRFTHQVLRYHGQTGAFLGVFASGGGLNTPFDLAFGPDCHLYVSSRGTASVIRYDGHTGALHGEFVPSGTAGLEADEPRGITFGPDGNLYVTSPRSDRVLRFHGSTGALLGSFVAAGAGGLDEPAGIRFGPDGALYVSSSITNDVKRFDGATGQFRDVFAVGGGLAHATFLTFSPAAVANRSPIAKAGEDVQVQSTGAPVQVQLDGTHSCDLDADPLTYEWREGAAFLGSTPTIAPFLGLGVHTLTLTVRDPFLMVGQDQVMVSVLQTITPPSNLTASAVSSSTIHLSWQDNSSDEDGFEIERRAGGAFAPVAISGPNNTAYSDNGLLPLTAYTYRIRGVNAGGISSYTPEAGAVTLTAPTAAPSDLSAGAVSDTEVRLHWIDNSDTETGFRIERRLSNGLFTQIATYGASPSLGRAVNFSDTDGLTANTTYGYRVRATGPGGDSPYSNEATIATTPVPPTAPTALTLIAGSSTAIQVSWTDTSNNETGFRVERKIGGGAFTFVGEAPADLPNFPDPGLTADTVYTYRVRATGTAGFSAFSAEAALPTPPLAPSGLGITVPAPKQLALVWTDNSQSESGFKIQRRTSSGAFTLAGTVSSGVTSFLDTGVAAGVTYTYQIRATNAGGDSAPSPSAMRLTLPATPTDFAVTPFSSTQLDLTWKDGNPSPPPLKVERGTDGVNFAQVAVTPGAATAYRDNNLTPETTYYYRVRTTNATGDSAVSAIASGRTFLPPPASPAALTAVAASGRSVQLTWQDQSSNEAGFEVWRLGPTGGAYQRISFTPVNSIAYLDRLDLSGLTSYRYRIRAVNDGGGSVFAQSNIVETPADVPAAPTAPGAASLSSSQIRVTWTDASDNETGFQVERKPQGGTFTLAGAAAAGATEFVDGSQAESAAYTYRVLAVNAQGSSPPSAEVSAVTRPAVPGNLVATAGNRKVDLSWSDNSALETGFKIERKSGAAAFTPLQTVATGVRTYSDAAVAAGVSYTYRVFAASAVGDSAPSNESSAIPRNETPLAKLVVAPRTVNFGTVRLGKTGRKTFKLTNKGKETLSGTVGSVSAPFALIAGGGAFTLAPKMSRVVTLTWTPAAAGAVAGVVEVTSTDPRMLKVDVRLTGKTR